MGAYIYDLYLIADSECELEENIYDLMIICDTHVCTLERVVENETDAVFEITGLINSILAIYYMDTSKIHPDYLHDAYFDVYSEFGMNLGKLLRYSFEFDPKTFETYDEREIS